MNSENARLELPTSVGVALAVVLLVSLVYALVAAQIFLWLFSVLAVGLFAFVLHLFYRLVIAVEEIAAKS